MEFDKSMIYKINGRSQWSYKESFIDFLRFRLQIATPLYKLAKEIGMGYAALKGIIDKNGIEIIPGKFDINFKAIYQDYDWCYKKFFTEGLNHKEMAKEANCSERVIEKWCNEVHRLNQEYRHENKQLNIIQQDLIVGSLLGDGHIDKRPTQPLFIVGHAEDQKEYLYWKYDILKDVCNKEPSYIAEAVREFNGRGYKCQPSYRLCTRIQNCLIKYRNMTNLELFNNLNEFSFSIWMLDDANRSHSNWELCIAEMEDLFDDIKRILYKKFNINCIQKGDIRYITFDAISSRVIDQIILKNIPNNLDIIKSKITENYISKPQKYVYLNDNGVDITLPDFCRKYNANYKTMHRIYNKYKTTDGSFLLNLLREGEQVG